MFFIALVLTKLIDRCIYLKTMHYFVESYLNKHNIYSIHLVNPRFKVKPPQQPSFLSTINLFIHTFLEPFSYKSTLYNGGGEYLFNKTFLTVSHKIIKNKKSPKFHMLSNALSGSKTPHFIKENAMKQLSQFTVLPSKTTWKSNQN